MFEFLAEFMNHEFRISVSNFILANIFVGFVAPWCLKKLLRLGD